MQLANLSNEILVCLRSISIEVYFSLHQTTTETKRKQKLNKGKLIREYIAVRLTRIVSVRVQ